MVHVWVQLADCVGGIFFFKVGDFSVMPCTATPTRVHGGRPGLSQCSAAAARLLYSRELMQLLDCQDIITSR